MKITKTFKYRFDINHDHNRYRPDRGDFQIIRLEKLACISRWTYNECLRQINTSTQQTCCFEQDFKIFCPNGEESINLYKKSKNTTKNNIQIKNINNKPKIPKKENRTKESFSWTYCKDLQCIFDFCDNSYNMISTKIKSDQSLKEWTKGCSSIINQSRLHFCSAIKRWLESELKSKYPKYKKYDDFGFEIQNGRKSPTSVDLTHEQKIKWGCEQLRIINNHTIYHPSVGELHIFENLEKLQNIIKDPTCNFKITQPKFTKKNGNYYISIPIEYEAQDPCPLDRSKSAAIDINARLDSVIYYGSEDKQFKCSYPEEKIKKLEKEIVSLQQDLSRKKNEAVKQGTWRNKETGIINKSNRYIRTQEKLSKLWEYYVRIMEYTENNFIKEIIIFCKENDIGLLSPDHLRPKNNKRAKGKGARAKSGLNRVMRRIRPGTIKNKIKYRAGWNGIEIIELNPFFTSSRLCPLCPEPHINSRKSLTKEYLTCERGSGTIQRDIASVINQSKEAKKIKGLLIQEALKSLPK